MSIPIDFIPSEEAKERIADLIHREKTTGLTSEETAELNYCLQLEHLMRLTKIPRTALFERMSKTYVATSSV